MTVTRSQTGKTPKKPEFLDGIVETPSRRTTRKKTKTDDSESPSPTRSNMARDAMAQSSGNDVKSKSNGQANGKANGHANGNANGSANGSANTKSSKPRIVDGWLVGGDPKIDADPHFDFGGTIGVSLMMLGFPLLMWYMWVGAHYYDGKFPTRSSSDESYLDFVKHLFQLAYVGAFPHRKAWAIYWVFGTAQCAFYYFMPGVYVKGKALLHNDNKPLMYYCSGVWSFYTTIVAAVALHVTGTFKLYTLIDEFGPIMSVAILSGFIVSIIAYFSAIARGQEHRMTGYPIYDFFMGAELNPRLFEWIDMKMFFEVRLPWYILFLVSLGGAARQYETYGYVTPEMSFLLMAHFLYANACCKGEELIPVSWDMFYEKWGFMLIFWNMAGVPLSYCHCTIYLANHDPSEYSHSRLTMFLFFTTYVFMYWVWDTGNSQAKFFRAEERGYHIQRAAFPQLPWKKIDNPEKIVSDCGDSILCDGWFKMARKIHYTCDMYFAITWGLITGFNSPFPWFYPTFFAVMILHRAIRDVQRCRNKYGEAWMEYERRVPALFIPYVI